jgi:glycosyltransferase involved in cell wall biosynthesis
MYRDCDLAINGRNMGESFGFSIVEPLSVGKPVLAPDSIRHPRMDANHISLLRPVGLTFYSARDLVKKMRFLLNGNYNSDKYIEIANQYSPAISMSRFYNFFLAEELP